MSIRKLIILSGAGDPENPKYMKVYNLIVDYAKRLNYGEIIIQNWKGQDSFMEKGFLNMKDATNTATHLFMNIEDSGNEYDVICRSFGAGVFLNVCQNLQLQKIGFASLWGISTYTAAYELFKEKIKETIESSKSKGVAFDETFFESVIPFDLLLCRFNQNFRVNIISGAADIISPPAFNGYLKESIKNENLHFSSPISGLLHEVMDYHQEYLERLFSKY